MREILFRGKSLYDNNWVEGFYVHANKSYGEYIDRHFIVEHGEFEYDEYDAWKVIPETVGQYTGLCDKNGKKIFEGDIVAFKTRTSYFKPGYVRWYEEEARFLVVMSDGVHSYPMDRSWEYEVIGNVHDNPELLGGH